MGKLQRPRPHQDELDDRSQACHAEPPEYEMDDAIVLPTSPTSGTEMRDPLLFSRGAEIDDSPATPGARELLRTLARADDIADQVVSALGGPDNSAKEEIRNSIRAGRCNPRRSYADFAIHNKVQEKYALLKSYQQAGLQWLMVLFKSDQNGILADEMGLGKTAQTIVFLSELYATCALDRPSVVACPAGLVDNWIAEIKTWGPGLNLLKYHGLRKERISCIETYDSAEEDIHIIVTSLQTLTSPWDRSMFFKHIDFGYLVVDEAHSLKNSESRLYRQMKSRVNATRRILLTGSPVQNEIAELRNIVAFVSGELFEEKTLDSSLSAYASVKARERRIATATVGGQSSEMSAVSEGGADPVACAPDKDEASLRADSDVEFLQRSLAPFILRRLKQEVMSDLPRKISKIEVCVMDGRQLSMYLKELSTARTGLASSLRALSTSASDAGPPPEKPRAVSAKKNFVNGLLFRLRRICNHPLLGQGLFTQTEQQELIDYCHKKTERFAQVDRQRVEEVICRWSDMEIHQFAKDVGDDLAKYHIPVKCFLESTKIRRMLDLIRSTKEAGLKCLVFSQFTSYLDVIQETLVLTAPDILFFRLDGDTPVRERQALVDRFGVEPEITVFMLSTKAGGVGLNLTAANTVLLMDQDWNPHNDRQAEDRVHRLGQHRDVTVYRLCCRGTVEESILRCCKRKLDLDEAFGGNSEFLSLAIIKDSLFSHEKVKPEESPDSDAAQEGENSSLDCNVSPVISFDEIVAQSDDEAASAERTPPHGSPTRAGKSGSTTATKTTRKRRLRDSPEDEVKNGGKRKRAKVTTRGSSGTKTKRKKAGE